MGAHVEGAGVDAGAGPSRLFLDLPTGASSHTHTHTNTNTHTNTHARTQKGGGGGRGPVIRAPRPRTVHTREPPALFGVKLVSNLWINLGFKRH